MKIYDISLIPSSLLDTVGGKAKGLNKLKNFSFNVPKGFVIMDIDTEQDIIEAYDYYTKSGLEKVAIRSSATIEDGLYFSNAGLYETVLNVCGKENFIDAVKQCIGSLNNERSQKYSDMFFNSENNKMTVVVQEMIEAKFAGVLFTKDPMDESKVLIEAVTGLGESLVSGEAAAQQYRVKDGAIEYPENPVLDEKTILALYEGALKAEKDFGIPMDIEWAVNDDLEINYLQARPITVLSDDVTVNEFDYPYDVTDFTITTCNIKEMLPTAVTPLTLSTSVYCLDYGMRKMMAENHAIKKVEDLHPYACITPYYNNLFFNMTTNYINAYRIAGTCKETSDISICGRVLEEFPDKFADYSSQFTRVKNMIYFLPYILSPKKAKNGMDEAIANYKFNYNDTMEGLYNQSVEKFKYLQDVFFYHYCSSYFSGAATMLTRRAISAHVKDSNKVDSLLSGVLTDIEGIESAKILDMMKKIAGAILEECPEAEKYNKHELAAFIEKSTGKVKEYYDQFIEANGHRGISEEELRINSWSDDLVSFSETLRGVILTYNFSITKTDKKWTEYLDEVLTTVRRRKRNGLKKQIERGRQGVYLREYTKTRCVLAVSRLRKLYKILAAKLVEEKIIPDTDLIFFFTKEEIGDLVKGDKTLVKKAIKRRRLYPEQCAMKFEEVYCGKPVPIKTQKNYDKVTSLTGVPASLGNATGRVRIVKTLEDANKLQRGEIMVVSTTDVGWTPYYCIAAGLITEIGSCLSHGVVVAREYGLPTIVNVTGVLNILKTGDVITMDSRDGSIFVLNTEEGENDEIRK